LLGFSSDLKMMQSDKTLILKIESPNHPKDASRMTFPAKKNKDQNKSSETSAESEDSVLQENLRMQDQVVHVCHMAHPSPTNVTNKKAKKLNYVHYKIGEKQKGKWSFSH
jgi:hypothetical protein